MASVFSLSNRERLKDSTAISDLFSKKSDKVGIRPLLLFYRIAESKEDVAQVMFTVSKKKFGKAVDRNRIKRLMREAYRLEKPLLKDYGLSSGYQFAMVYTGDKEQPLSEIRSSLKKAYEAIVKRNQ